MNKENACLKISSSTRKFKKKEIQEERSTLGGYFDIKEKWKFHILSTCFCKIRSMYLDFLAEEEKKS